MSDDGSPTVQDILERVISVPTSPERLRRLRDEEDRYSSDLVECFRKSAETTLRHDPRDAARRAHLGLVVATAIRDVRGRVGCLTERTKAAVMFGDSVLALDSVEEALRLVRLDVRDEALEAHLELLRLQPLILLERYGEAQSSGERVLGTFERRGDRSGCILTHMALADLAFRLDRPREALRHYSAVDRLLPPTAPPQAKGMLAMNRAISLDARNRFRAASRQFELARGLFSAAGYEHAVAQVDYNSAYSDLLRGRYQDSLRRYADCEPVFQRLDDGRHLAHIDLDRAEIHLHLNLPEDAAAFAAAAEARFLILGLSKECAQASYVYARAAKLRGDATTAMSWFERAEKLFRTLGLEGRVFSCVLSRGQLLEQQGDAAAARELAAEARELLGEDANPLAKSALDLFVGRLDLAAGERMGAIEAAEEALETCRRIHAPWLRIDALQLVGRARAQLGELAPAIEAYGRAIDELDRFRRGVPPDEFMAAFLAGRTALYEEIVDVLVLAGNTPIAFEYTERAKSRALVDLLAARRDGPAVRREDESLDKRLRLLRERLSAVYQQLVHPDGESRLRAASFVLETCERAKEIEQQIAILLRRRRVEDRRTTPLDTVDPPDLAEIRARLEPDTAIVEYLFTGRALTVFALTQDDVRLVRREALPGNLAHLVDRFRFHLTRAGVAGSDQAEAILCTTRADLAALGDWLLQPLAPWLAAMRRLVIVPHEELHHLPFHALPWGDGWLSDAFEIVYAPSATVYGYCRDAGGAADGDSAVFGLPDEFAPHIEAESCLVARTIGASKLYLREAATFERLREEAARARFVHVATRGMFRREHPTLSSIRLSDRWIDLHDLYELDVRGELVVLSTWESGAANANSNNELLGLIRGFLLAGAPALLTSQWRVDASVTAQFMETFYEALAAGEGAAAAHRRSMKSVRERHPHPFFWASWFLIGCPVDGRRPANGGSARAARSSEDPIRSSTAEPPAPASSMQARGPAGGNT